MIEPRNAKKPLRVRYHFSLVFFVAVAIFGVMFYQYMKKTTLESVLSDSREISVPALSDNNTVEKDPDPDTDSDSSVEPGEIVNPVPESEKAEKDYLDSCVFIGDSLTYGLSSYGVVPASSVYASMAMNVAKAETEQIDTQFGKMTIIDALTESKPENIYIMLGSNGAAWLTVSDMYKYYKSFADRVYTACPESKIYLISVPPVTSEREASKESPILNKDIDRFNEKLLEYADVKQMYYLDVNGYLKGDLSCLPSSDAENDGQHFKYSTYEKFVDYILTHVAG